MAMTTTQAREVQGALIGKGFDLGRSGADGDYGGKTHAANLAAIAASPALSPILAPAAPAVIGLTDADYAAAATKLSAAAGRTVSVKQVKVIKIIESGSAWFTDIRADVLAADGDPDGGFIDGDRLAKILFEAKEFHKRTGGRYDVAHPNISSPTWNRSLYIGGQGEYIRLAKAMALNEVAALESASVGLFQVMGYHWKALGYASVHDYWARMQASEANQLDAFVRFVIANKLASKLARGGATEASWVPFVEVYNGAGHASNRYAPRAADTFKKF